MVAMLLALDVEVPHGDRDRQGRRNQKDGLEHQ
jgi:hypothetical protein